MTPETIITELLKQTNPSALVWLAGSAAILKFGMDLVKRCAPNLKGNVVQTVTGALALLAATVQAGTAGVFTGGVDAKEALSVLGVAALTYLSAVGVNETLTNQNKPAPAEGGVEVTEAEAQLAAERVEPAL